MQAPNSSPFSQWLQIHSETLDRDLKDELKALGRAMNAAGSFHSGRHIARIIAVFRSLYVQRIGAAILAAERFNTSQEDLEELCKFCQILRSELKGCILTALPEQGQPYTGRTRDAIDTLIGQLDVELEGQLLLLPNKKTHSESKASLKRPAPSKDAVNKAVNALWPNGIPATLHAQTRNEQIVQWCRDNHIIPPSVSTIKTALAARI